MELNVYKGFENEKPVNKLRAKSDHKNQSF
jgi:hypothetical protein